MPDAQATAQVSFASGLVNGALSQPGAIPPFGLWLFYAALISNSNFTRLVLDSGLLGSILPTAEGSAGLFADSIPKIPPFDPITRKGLAITPDTEDVKALVNSLVNQSYLREVASQWIDTLDARVSTTATAAGLLIDFRAQLQPFVADFLLPEYAVKFYATEEEIEEKAADGVVWAALVFTETPSRSPPTGEFADGDWKYKLRFNTSLVPNTMRRHDQFKRGLSTDYYGI